MNTWQHIGTVVVIIAAVGTAAVELTKKLDVLFSEICILLSNIF